MNAAFSPRNLADFEVYMHPHITSLVKRFRKYAMKSEVFDFQQWGKKRLLLIYKDNTDQVRVANFLAFDLMGEWAFGSSFGFVAAGKDIHNLIHTLEVRTDVVNVMGHLPLFIRPYM
jgi:benzoate 4-monooxygenase